MIEFYGRKLNAYKASLHTHSTNSDGRFTPEKVIEMYKEHGYDVLAFTDHRFVTRIGELDGKGLTLIQSLEMHPIGPRGIHWHLVALNVSDDYVYDESIGAQGVVDYAVADGAMVICAHPYWCGFTSEEVASLKNLSAIEVYNTSTRYIGRQFNMQLWDELSDKGLVYPATAVDDMHSPHDLFRGWTVIAAEDNSAPSVMNALKQGHFYATMGPEFTKLSFKDNVFEASFTPCKEVIGLTNPSRGFCIEVEDKEGYGMGSIIRTECRIEIPPLPGKERWFRLQIKDEAGRYAWTAPIVIPPQQ
ncbi:MAG: CehA/McbA family metallohydrolase [Victivallales bacterium]|nr:CehA/McbA family metallohydrolase [Victivallales bacterium]